MTTYVNIYKTTKVSTQSGKGKADRWCLEVCASEIKKQDPITGWFGSGDTATNLKLYFETSEQAVDYCTKNDLSYDLQPPTQKKITPKSYTDNFLKFR